MKKLILLSISIVALFCISSLTNKASAQVQQVTVQVLDASGSPIANASVVNCNITGNIIGNGASTDNRGIAQVTVLPTLQYIKVSFIGYQTSIVYVGSMASITVVLFEDVEG